MQLTRIEELTLSLARGAAGGTGNGQIFTLILVGVLTGIGVRGQIDLGLVVSGICLLGVLSVLERRQVYAIIQKLEGAAQGADTATAELKSDARAEPHNA